MKRIVSLLLCLMMFLCTNVSVLAEKIENETVENESQLYDKLSALGCVWEINSYDGQKYVTRGEFAFLLSKFLNKSYSTQDNYSDSLLVDMEELLNGSHSEVNDVVVENSQNIKYYDEVKCSVENGLMRIYDNGEFAPEENISIDDVCYAFVKLLGYSENAEVKGGYPNGYVDVAYDIGILEGVKKEYSNYVTTDKCLKIIDNAIECDMMVLKYSNVTPMLCVEEGRNLLGTCFSIYKHEGRITANEYSGLQNSKGAGEGEFIIDDKTMYVGDTDAAFLLGYEVEVYYRDDDDEYTALWLEVEDEELFIYAEDIEDFNDRVLKYEYKGKSKSAKISQKARIIYNGVAVSEYSREDFLVQTGDVTLLKENGGSEYDLVIIQSYDNYVVDTVHFDKNIIYAKNNKKLSWDENAKVIIYSDKFIRMNAEDIKANSVISAGVSKDGNLITLMVTNKNISGTIKNISREDNKISVTIDDKEYFLDSYYYENNSLIPMGGSGIFYFDIDGKIAYFDVQTYGKWISAYIIRKFHDDNGVYNIKYFDGEVKDGVIADNFKMDDIRFKNEDAEMAITAEKFALIKRNSSGQITEIDYASEGKSETIENENSLRAMYTISSNTYYRPNTVSFGKFFLMNNDTEVFVLPEEKSDYSKYELTTVSKFTNRTYSGISAYCIGDMAEFAEYVVYDKAKDVYQFTNEAVFYILKNIEQTIDENDEVVNVMKYYTSEGVLQESIVLKDVDISELEPGDIFKLYLDDNNKVAVVEKVFDCEEKELAASANNDRVKSYYTHAYRRINRTIFMSNGNDENLSDVYKLDTVPVNCSVFVFDRSKRILSAVSVYDIIDWERNNKQYTEFFIRFYYDDPQVIFIWE